MLRQPQCSRCLIVYIFGWVHTANSNTKCVTYSDISALYFRCSVWLKELFSLKLFVDFQDFVSYSVLCCRRWKRFMVLYVSRFNLVYSILLMVFIGELALKCDFLETTTFQNTKDCVYLPPCNSDILHFLIHVPLLKKMSTITLEPSNFTFCRWIPYLKTFIFSMYFLNLSVNRAVINDKLFILHTVSLVSGGRAGSLLYCGFYLFTLHSVFSLHTTLRVIKYVVNTAPW